MVKNSTLPESTLNNRHNAICYHKVRESQAAKIIKVGWIEGKRNLADLFTKTTLTTEQHHNIVSNIFSNDTNKRKR